MSAQAHELEIKRLRLHVLLIHIPNELITSVVGAFSSIELAKAYALADELTCLDEEERNDVGVELEWQKQEGSEVLQTLPGMTFSGDVWTIWPLDALDPEA